MLQWAVTFLIIALISAVLGFGGLADLSADLARVSFAIFIALFVITALMHASRGKTPPI